MSHLQGRFLGCHSEYGYFHCTVLNLLFLCGIINEAFRKPEEADSHLSYSSSYF